MREGKIDAGCGCGQREAGSLPGHLGTLQDASERRALPTTHWDHGFSDEYVMAKTVHGFSSPLRTNSTPTAHLPTGPRVPLWPKFSIMSIQASRRLRFKLDASVIAAVHTYLAFAAFFSALFIGCALHYKKIVKNGVAGYPEEWFPSVSATYVSVMVQCLVKRLG